MELRYYPPNLHISRYRLIIKGTINLMTMSDSQRFPWHLYLINIVEDIVVLLGSKVFNSDNSNMISCSINAQVTFLEKPQLQIISFQDYNHSYQISTFWDKAVVNQALPFLHWGSLEIALTVPLSQSYWVYFQLSRTNKIPNSNPVFSD